MEVKRTDKIHSTRFLNMFDRKFEHNDKESNWFFVSREDPPLPHAEKKPDAVVIIAEMMHEGHNCLVVTSEFRIPIMEREWGFPAGLIEDGEDPKISAIREFKEETGLEFVPSYTSPPNLYSSAGLTNESTILVFGTATGTPSDEHLEELEDIETFVWDWGDLSLFMEECKEGRHAIGAKAWCIFHHYHLNGIKQIQKGEEPSI